MYRHIWVDTNGGSFSRFDGEQFAHYRCSCRITRTSQIESWQVRLNLPTHKYLLAPMATHTTELHCELHPHNPL